MTYSEIREEILKKDYDFHKTMLKTIKKGTTCSNFYWKNDAGYNFCYSAPCYGRLLKGKNYVFVKIFFPERYVSDLQGWKQIYNWIMNESIFSNSFITKDLKEGLKEGFEINLDADNITTFLAMQALRQLFERDNPIIYEELLKGGLSVENAFIYRHYLRMNNGKIQLSNSEDDHALFPYLILGSIPKFKRFLQTGRKYYKPVFKNVFKQIDQYLWETTYDESIDLHTPRFLYVLHKNLHEFTMEVFGRKPDKIVNRWGETHYSINLNLEEDELFGKFLPYITKTYGDEN